MTKTLTEQWRDGTLPLGTYYILNIYGDEEIDMSVAVGELWNNTDLKEVLAPVPSYDEYKQLVSNSDESPTEQVLNLQNMVEDECSRRCELETKCSQLEKKIAIATKALKDLELANDIRICMKAQEALTKMEGIK